MMEKQALSRFLKMAIECRWFYATQCDWHNHFLLQFSVFYPGGSWTTNRQQSQPFSLRFQCCSSSHFEIFFSSSPLWASQCAARAVPSSRPQPPWTPGRSNWRWEDTLGRSRMTEPDRTFITSGKRLIQIHIRVLQKPSIFTFLFLPHLTRIHCCCFLFCFLIFVWDWRCLQNPVDVDCNLTMANGRNCIENVLEPSPVGWLVGSFFSPGGKQQNTLSECVNTETPIKKRKKKELPTQLWRLVQKDFHYLSAHPVAPPFKNPKRPFKNHVFSLELEVYRHVFHTCNEIYHSKTHKASAHQLSPLYHQLFNPQRLSESSFSLRHIKSFLKHRLYMISSVKVMGKTLDMGRSEQEEWNEKMKLLHGPMFGNNKRENRLKRSKILKPHTQRWSKSKATANRSHRVTH